MKICYKTIVSIDQPKDVIKSLMYLVEIDLSKISGLSVSVTMASISLTAVFD